MKGLECDVGCSYQSYASSEPTTVIDVRHSSYSQSPPTAIRFDCSPVDVMCQSLSHQVCHSNLSSTSSDTVTSYT